MLDSKDKPTTTANIDTIVSAELPDKEQFPHCLKTIVNAMIHGPCGDDNPNAPCMIRSKKGNSYCSTMFAESNDNRARWFPKIS